MNKVMDYVLAQVNIGRLLAPLDSAQLADFVAALDPVNAVADAAPVRLATADRGGERDLAARLRRRCLRGGRQDPDQHVRVGVG